MKWAKASWTYVSRFENVGEGQWNAGTSSLSVSGIIKMNESRQIGAPPKNIVLQFFTQLK
jgi:hypothetical protein